MLKENPKHIFPLPDYSNPIPLNDEQYGIHIEKLQKEWSIYFNNKVIEIVKDIIPEELRTKPVVNFALYTYATRHVGAKRDSPPENLKELQEDILGAYDSVSGASVSMIVSYLYYPDEGRTITLDRYQKPGREGWINSLERGLVDGFFQLENDQNTVIFHPQVKELFFPESK